MDSNPSTIGRYRIDGVLGGGAMGVIYRAYDPEIDRKVAIKLIRADLLSGGSRSDYILRFRREAQAAGRCLHPNIVTVYDLALHDGNPYIAMELVEGESLSQARERGARFAPNQAVFVIVQVLDALAAAHKMGIVHRDIKPANILIDSENGTVKVTDFGISRVDTSELTGAGLMIGTPSYMSPEQCRGGEVDARSDLFSAGVVLYELLCGERPFAAPNATAVMQRLLNEPPDDLSALNPSLPPTLRSAVGRALAKSPDERFASAGEMAAALRALMSDDAAPTVVLDRTIVMPKARSADVGSVATRSSASSATQSGTLGTTGPFDSATLATIERKLTQHLGPIARVVLKGALRPGETAETLCDTLAAAIPEPTARGRFRAEALAELKRSTATSASGSAAAPIALPSSEFDRVEKELTRFLGPIARVLVRRKAAEARSIKELWDLLASHIERPEERSAFLRRIPSEKTASTKIA